MYSWALRTQRRSFMHMATLVDQLGHLQGQRSLIDQLESFPWQSLFVLNEIKVFNPCHARPPYGRTYSLGPGILWVYPPNQKDFIDF